jgi:hypothetical protein
MRKFQNLNLATSSSDFLGESAGSLHLEVVSKPLEDSVQAS